MCLTPEPWWPVMTLAVALCSDAALSVRPPKFIRDCLNGVGFPHDWWWTLIVIKTLATVALVAGIWIPGVAFAANLGVIFYFVCAAAAHIRAHFTGQAFWLNCIGMLALSVGAFTTSFVI